MEPLTSETYHAVLAKSYMVYFLAAIVGIFIDLVFPIPLYTSSDIPFARALAVICFALGPILIFWAQYTSRHTKKNGNKHQYFLKGPYKFLRNPTQLGLVLLVAGYAFIMHSLGFLIAIIFAYCISNFYFKHYEKLLEKKYGASYVEYEKNVTKVL